MGHLEKSSERNETSTSSSTKSTRGFDLFRSKAKQNEIKNSLLKNAAMHDTHEHLLDCGNIDHVTVEKEQKKNSNDGYRKKQKKSLFNVLYSVVGLNKSDQVKKKSSEQVARLQKKAVERIQRDKDKEAKQIQGDQKGNLRRENKNRAMEQRNKENEKSLKYRIKPALKRILTTTAFSAGTGAAVGTGIFPGIGTGVLGAVGAVEGVSVSVAAEIAREVKIRDEKLKRATKNKTGEYNLIGDYRKLRRE